MKYGLISLGFAAAALSGCTGLEIAGSGAAAAGIIHTQPDAPPPADTKDQIPEHADWCYQTMGDSQCYAHPQDLPPDTLINVDPQSIYPIDLPAYYQALHTLPVPPPPFASEQPQPLEPVLQAPLTTNSTKGF